ncbi:L-seryl-tRNA(Sec) selenium transferase [Sphaerisporangium aureirubrum]|uniref:L-seryl-tRNA(Sec) selenium transferase n=2 Tax=Sphaerisporangium aureirubrum TaxID=1544736 RepID=A0ABW1NWG2_9ACTN
MTDPRRQIPRTDAVLDDPRFTPLVGRMGRDRVKTAVNAAQQRARDGEIGPSDVYDEALRTLPDDGPRPVINATGVLLHTNLGRAPLSEAALDAVRIAGGTTDVEFDLATGHRGRRGRAALAALGRAVPAAEAVHVVNNNAAALVLVATALAREREIVISRGELVEIGDGFRLPELLASTGARLREVGTTNRTSVADYATAIGPQTGFVLKIHPSNYRIEGFAGTPSVSDLAGLEVPLVADIGSGLLAPEPLLPDEPDAATWLRAGADLVTASGDKLLGGPQCGLLLGRAGLVELVRRHPLARALRVDKLTLAALEATLVHAANPTRDALRADPAELRRRAGALAVRLAAAGVKAEAVDTGAAVGGGGAPCVELPSAAVAVDAALAGPLRRGTPAVVGRVEGGRCLLDLRAVPPGQDGDLLGAVVATCS